MREQATHSALLAATMAAAEKAGRERAQDKAFEAANPQPDEATTEVAPSPSPKRRERRLSTGPTMLRVLP